MVFHKNLNGVLSESGSAVSTDDNDWMVHALKLAEMAEANGEVPVGALLVHDGKVIGEGWNRPIASCDPTAHAEVLALRSAGSHIGNYRMPAETTLYVTLEPCVMCMGAISHARVGRLVFGAPDPKRGAVCSALQLSHAEFLNHHVPWVGGVEADACSELLRQFFRKRRMKPAKVQDEG